MERFSSVPNQIREQTLFVYYTIPRHFNEDVLKEQKNAIVIPGQYLIDQSSYVYRYENGKAVKTKIKYEAGPSTRLLVTEGLKNGDVIIMPEASVYDGADVKISKGA